MVGVTKNVRIFQNLVYSVWRWAFSISNSWRWGMHHSSWELDNITVFNNGPLVCRRGTVGSVMIDRYKSHVCQ